MAGRYRQQQAARSDPGLDGYPAPPFPPPASSPQVRTTPRPSRAPKPPKKVPLDSISNVREAAGEADAA
eukprot:4686768-Prorocentrum_lima.AAC.1